MASDLTGRPRSIWHRGELEIQRSIGVDKQMEALGPRLVHASLSDQHRMFFTRLPFVVAGSVDAAGDAWATLITGRPGFMTSPDDHTLSIRAPRQPADPADAGLEDGHSIALLGIELDSRRRNRLNGVLHRRPDGFDVSVVQSFGNCPQYIQLRDVDFARDPGVPSSARAESLVTFDEAALDLIRSADTFFVASYSDEGGSRQVDVSHRGGKPGFVRVGEDGMLTIPDFSGNLFFATLGNILLNKKVGLLFVDFAKGDVLQLTGDADVLLDSPEIEAFDGAERLWHVRPSAIVRRRDALPLRWVLERGGWSPNLLATGDWSQAAERLRARELAGVWRPYRVVRIVQESSTIKSFFLEPADGRLLPRHQAGQHLPIRVQLPGVDRAAIRTYTLSAAPADRVFRISVKRDGAVSRFLHDRIGRGDLIEAAAPAGVFTIDAREPRPAVLLAAGVGITPILAMARYLVLEGLRTHVMRPTYLFYAARSKAERAFDDELAEIVVAARGALHLKRILSNAAGASPADYDHLGRLDVDILRSSLPPGDCEFYLCGPPAFMQALYEGLRALKVADERIHAETFGPASLERGPDGGFAARSGRAAAAKPVRVAFMTSSKEARWEPGSGSLLELAEARGLEPPFSCRVGTCGTCRTKILKGAVAYIRQTTAEVDEDEALICSAVPAQPRTGEDSGLQLAL